MDHRFVAFESMQTALALDVNVAVRFSMTILAIIAVTTGVREIWCVRKMDRPIVFTPDTYAMFFFNRVLIAASVLFTAPAAAWRLGYTKLPPELCMWLFVAGNVAMCVYFLVSETIRLVLTQEIPLWTAVRNSWFFVAGALILGILGLYTVWT